MAIEPRSDAPKAIVKTAPTDLKSEVKKMEDQFRLALPPHVTPEKFVRVVMTAIQVNPDLAKADRQSVLAACMRAAQDGLLPDGKEAALVTFRSNGTSMATYIPMVMGILKKVRNSGELASISSQLVYEKDAFRFWADDKGEHLEHEPDVFSSDRGRLRGVYAMAVTKDGAVYIEVMSHDQVMAVKASSKAQNGPWSGSFEHEMWRKTAIRRLSKRLPMSSDLEDTIRRDDDLFDVDAANSHTPDKGKKLEQILSGADSGARELEIEIPSTAEDSSMFVGSP